MLRNGIVRMFFYVAPTELEYGSIIRSTNMSSLRDYKLMDFDENNANFQSSDRSDMFVVRAQGSMFKPQRGGIT